MSTVKQNLASVAGRYWLTGIVGMAAQTVATPYWINLDAAPYRLDAPLRGKGTPAQIEEALWTAMDERKLTLTSADEVRSLMVDLGLGIDCSGFVFNVLDGYMRQFGGSLADGLEISRSEVAEGIKRHPERHWPVPEGDDWDVLPLGVVSKAWKKSPVDAANVRRLTDPATAKLIGSAGEIRIGDMIAVSRDRFDHIGVVVNVLPELAVIASSDEIRGELGGVSFHELHMVEPTKGLEAQDWAWRESYQENRGCCGIWRLNILDQLQTAK